MEHHILHLIKVKRSHYSNDSYFLFNECSNKFHSNEDFLNFIDNQAHVLIDIMSKTKFFLPIYQMANVYFYNRSRDLLLL